MRFRIADLNTAKDMLGGPHLPLHRPHEITGELL